MEMLFSLRRAVRRADTNFFLYSRGTTACIWDHSLSVEGQVDEYQHWKKTVREFVGENVVLRRIYT